MFWTFTFSFDQDILAFFGFATVSATLSKMVNFSQSSGHPGLLKHCVLKSGTFERYSTPHARHLCMKETCQAAMEV